MRISNFPQVKIASENLFIVKWEKVFVQIYFIRSGNFDLYFNNEVI